MNRNGFSCVFSAVTTVASLILLVSLLLGLAGLSQADQSNSTTNDGNDYRAMTCTRCPEHASVSGNSPHSASPVALTSLSFVGWMFDTSNYPPRWHCGTWTPTVGWLHIISDTAIFAAYTAIPCALAFFVLRRRDTPFLPVFWLFVAFIFFCGFGHLVEATIFWHPWYHFSGVIKACTAVVSWATVLVLLPLLPKALALPSLAGVNKQLELEVAERQAAETKLQRSYDDLQDFTRNVLGREDRVLELKQEVNGLLQEMGRVPRYCTEATDG